MGTFISSALEEICYHGPAGVSLSSLCSTLALTPPSIKASLWTNLLSIPSLQFTVPGNDMPFSPDDDKIKRFEDAEKLYLKIVAKEHLRGSFVGLYDTTSTGISSNQRRALKRLAMKDVSVTTNLLYLYGHAKHLGIQQRFEESVEESGVHRDGFDGDFSCKDNVVGRDYLPISNKVLVTVELKDIKLGEMLKDAYIIEDFKAKVDGRVCLKNLSSRNVLSR
ncbi:hypothetical protein Peur_039881 [Populus x canadensis]